MSNTTLHAAIRVLQTPGARIGLAVAALFASAAAMGSAYVYTQARSAECQIATHDPLSMDQLIDVKKRFKNYKRNPDSGITLTGNEISMLLEDRADVPVYVDVRGQHLHAQVAVPSSDHKCWPIDFEGDLSIEGGVAYVTPSRLTVGSVDLSGIASGMRMELLPEHMPTAKAALFLEQTRTAVVDGGEMRVELTAPSEFSLHR